MLRVTLTPDAGGRRVTLAPISGDPAECVAALRRAAGAADVRIESIGAVLR